MSKWFRENAPISAHELTEEFMRLKRGSVTRRHFLGVTGLGLAAAVLARQPGLFNSAAYAQQEDLGSAMSIATWPKSIKGGSETIARSTPSACSATT